MPKTIIRKCLLCDKEFTPYRTWEHELKKGCKNAGKYCSQECGRKSLNKRIIKNCGTCGTQVTIRRREVKTSKSGKNFCSKSCSAIYNNAHKTKGNRRSKLEVWLGIQLTKNYPNLEIIFNGKETINSELDIYFPSLKLAIELNGIFHYEPIYGKEKLASIQNNDERKFQACLEQGIELVTIDSSALKYFKAEKAKKYYDIIVNILTKKIQ